MVSLNKPAEGSTGWATPVNNNWTAIEKQLVAMQGRLQRDSATQVSLQRYGGDTVDVNGESVSLGAGGIALLTTDNRITSTGADAGAAMAADTLYYVYLSNSSASFAATDLRASTTAPTSFNGIKYLGTSGNATSWRFIGWVRTNASTQFEDNTTNRLVVNYYNRQRKHILINPGYSNGNTESTYTRSGNWTAANGGTDAQGSFISNGEDAVEFTLTAMMAVPDDVRGYAGIAIGDSASVSTSDIRAAEAAGASGTPDISTNVAAYRNVEAEGYRTVNLYVASSGGTTTYYADAVRNGATTDPRVTYITGTVMA